MYISLDIRILIINANCTTFQDRITFTSENGQYLMLYLYILKHQNLNYYINSTTLQDRISFTSEHGQYFKSQEDFKLFYFIYLLN